MSGRKGRNKLKFAPKRRIILQKADKGKSKKLKCDFWLIFENRLTLPLHPESLCFSHESK